MTAPALCFHLAMVALLASREVVAWRSGQLARSVAWSVALAAYGVLLIRGSEL